MSKTRVKLAKKKEEPAGRYPGEVKFRAEQDLRPRLAKIADRKRKDFSTFVRESLWQIVDSEEATVKPNGS